MSVYESVSYSDKEIDYILKYGANDNKSWQEVADMFNKKFDRNKSANAIRKTFKQYEFFEPEHKDNNPTKPKILLLDVETAPLEVVTWGIWDQNIPLSRIKKDWSILSWSAKWLGDDPKKIMYMDTFKQRDKRDDTKILKKMHKLLDEADFVVGHHSDKFDIPKLNARFILKGMRPPSSYGTFDTKKLATKYFGFTSNKLEYITHNLCTKYKKLKHGKFPGNTLWDEYLKGNKEAQKEMEEYNKYDVLSLEEAFLKFLPWESANLFQNYYNCDIDICTCGSIDFKKSGYYYTDAGKFQKLKCTHCGAEMRDKTNLIKKTRRKISRK